jgi:O-antigen/teichoic acid export membrane protein
MIMGFVSVPLTVYYLGAERYGVWLTISSLLLWLALTDFGLAGNALVNVLSEAVGNDDRVSAQQYTASAFWALLAIALVFAVIFVTFFQIIPWHAIFRVSSATPIGELKLACAFVLVLFVINLPLSLVRSVYTAHQEGYFSNLWWILSGILSLFCLFVVTRFRGGLPLLVVAMSGVPALIALASACHVFIRRYPWLALSPAAVRWACIRRLLQLGGKYMIIQLASLGIYQSQAIIITQTLDPSKVVIFAVTYRLVTLPTELAYLGTVPLISPFGEAKARRDWRWITAAFNRGSVAALSLGMPLAALLALVAKPFIFVWAGPSAVPDWGLVLWLFVYTAVGVSLMMPGQLLTGIERPEPLALFTILCATGCVGFGILFGRWWGLNGIAFAMAVSIIALSPIQWYEVLRVLRVAREVPPPSKIPPESDVGQRSRQPLG